jgi:hypothetical protein
MLGVPKEETWGRIPGATADDVAAWRLAKQREVAQALVQQAVAASQTAPPGSPAVPGTPAAPGSPPAVSGRSRAPEAQP